MAGPMPPGAPPPGFTPPPNQPPGPPQPQPNPTDQDPDAMQSQSPAMKAVSMANDGLMKLGTIFEQEKGAVSPEEQKKLAAIINDFHSLINDLSGEPQGSKPAPKPPGGPMPAMAGRGSTPLDGDGPTNT